MDRTLAHRMGLCLALLAGGASANDVPGLAQYQAAIVSQEQLATLTNAILEVSDADVKQRSPEATAHLREQLVTRATTFADQLEASAAQGFAPAQYTHGLMLRKQAYLSKDPTRRTVQACDVTQKAATSGLLAAALARSFFCKGTQQLTEFAAITAAEDKARDDLAAALEKTAPFAAYYPLLASVKEDCFARPSEPGELSAIERFQASQPGLLSLEQTRTEALYRLAVREFSGSKSAPRPGKGVVRARRLTV